MSTYPFTNATPVTVWEANIQWKGRRPDTVLVPLVDGEVSQPALDAARALATGNEVDLLIVNAVCLPEQTPFSLMDQSHDEHRKPVQDVIETVHEADPSLSVSGTIHRGRTRVATVADVVEDRDIGAVVVDQTWCSSRLSPLIRSPIEKLIDLVDCPIVTASSTPLSTPVESILVAVTADADSDSATEIASSIARASDAQIDRCYLQPSNRASTDRDRSETDLEGEVCSLEADDLMGALIERSQEYDVTILSAPQHGRFQQFLCGSMPTDLRATAQSAVLTVWAKPSNSGLPAAEAHEG